VAHNVTNVLNYAFLVVMSQLLAPAEFALFAALFGVIYLASALANTIQTSVAAAVASATDSGREVAMRILRQLALWGIALGALTLLAARPLASFLHSDGITPVLVTGLSLWLFLVAAVGYGALQGSSRFLLLAGGVLIAAAGRLLIGPLLLVAGLGVDGALLGVALGLLLSAAFVLLPVAGETRSADQHSRTGVALNWGPALLLSVAIAIPTSADVFLVQHYLAGEVAGAYAAVSVLGKVIIFGPLAISLVYFPRMVREHSQSRSTWQTLRRAFTATAAVAIPLALIVAGLAIAAPDIVLRGYHASSGHVLTYLGAMLAFSLVIPLMYHGLAVRNVAFVRLVFAVLLGELVAVAVSHGSALEISAVALAGNVAILVTGLAVAYSGWRPAGTRAGAATVRETRITAPISRRSRTPSYPLRR